MAEAKTKPTEQSVRDFINQVPDEGKRKDAFEILEIMEAITKTKAKMWGPSIIGFGSYHYKYESGREGDAPLTGFSPRKASLTIYSMSGFEGYEDLLKKLGKCKTGKGCLYINRLSDVHMPTLKAMIKKSFQHMKAIHK